MKTVKWLLAVAALGLLAAAAAAAWLWHRVHLPYAGFAGDELTLEIRPGQDARGILEQLEGAGVLADATLARAYLVYVLKDPPLKAGEYAFRSPATLPEVLDRLVRGEVVTHAVTLVEGMTLDETARHLAERGFGDYELLRQAMSDSAAIADLDPTASDLEGYLFPDTYHFARGTPETEIVAALVANFRARFERAVAPRLGPAGPSVRELVTLASVVEKEARLDEERAVIAGVYANRLERGIALYADPTVIYALKRLGRWDGNLRRPDLQLDSPYNTYRHPGLPPGPIASPGLASLIAAAEPADVPYLYFVSRNDGSHVFATTLAEHNRNVNRWQKAYWQKRWAEERRKKAGR